MANIVENESGWTLPESHDLGIHYFYRNLLKGNPIRERFFKQTLANIDRMNMAAKFDYETMSPKMKSVIGKTMVYYDQVQTMIMSANLPKEIEDDLFYHLDYHTTTRPQTICFLKVKEFFAFCGIDGVYDIENKKHFLVPYEPAHVVEHLNFEKWPQERIELFREKYARMMAEKGEVPDYAKDIRDMEDDLSLAHMEALYEHEYSRMEQHAHNLITANGAPLPALKKDWEAAAKAKGVDVEALEKARLDFLDKLPNHPAYGPLIKMRDDMMAEEKTKLEAAKEKYAPHEWIKNPSSFYDYDKDIGKRGRGWDTRMRRHMRDKDHWANVFWGTSEKEDYPNHELSEEEIAEAKAEYSGLIGLKDYYKVRYYLDRKIFERDVYPSMNMRRCAFEDWALRRYTMSPLNRGVIAEARREDIPVIFAQAIRDEMNDGLLESIKYPTRIERTNDGTGEYHLYLNGEWVERFHPKEFLPILEKSAEANKDPVQTAIDHKTRSDKIKELMIKAGLSLPELDDNSIDFKIKSPALDLLDSATATPMSGLSAEDQARMDRNRQSKRDLYQHLNRPPEEDDPLANYDPDKPIGINAQTQHQATQQANQSSKKDDKGKDKKQQSSAPGFIPAIAPGRGRSGMQGAAMAAGMGALPMMGINMAGMFKGRQNEAQGHWQDQPSSELNAVSQAREEAGQSSSSNSNPTQARSSWNRYADSLKNLGANIGNQFRELSPAQARSVANRMGDEMRKGLDLIKRAANTPIVPPRLLQECRKAIDEITKFIANLMQSLGRLLGRDAGPAPTP